MNALVASCYAAARKHLEAARVAQQNAVLFGMQVYRGGRKGSDARFMRKFWHRKRSAELALALSVRRKIPMLRAELRRLEQQHTEPPRAA